MQTIATHVVQKSNNFSKKKGLLLVALFSCVLLETIHKLIHVGQRSILFERRFL